MDRSRAGVKSGADRRQDGGRPGSGASPGRERGCRCGHPNGGGQIYRELNLRVGVENLADRGYTNHLNAKSPFTGTRISEPGRVAFVDLIWEF